MADLSRTLDVVTSYAASALRLASGMSVGPLGPRPKKLLELYDFEACPYCRKVREAMSLLDLKVMVYPCPKGGERFRPRVLELGGKLQFPFLVDPNTRQSMYESDDIVDHLFRNYGEGIAPLTLKLGPITLASSVLASLSRYGMGATAVPSRAPKKPLELWSFEASPYCRIAREALCVLELPYVLHNVAKGSPGRDAFIKRSGKMMVPYLADPNTGKEMFESADIVRYLHETYGKPS